MPLIQRPGDDRIDFVDGHTGAVVVSIASDGTIYSDKGVQPFPALVKAEAPRRPRPHVDAAPAPVVEPAPAPVVEPAPAPVPEPAPAPVVEPAPAPVPEPAPAPVVEPAPAPSVEPIAPAADLPSLAVQVAMIATALKAKGIL